MSNQLQKVISLAKKTGDRLIVFDPQNNSDTYVVMPLDEYEKLVIGKSEVRSLTEDELLDKINRDIAIWKSEQDFGCNTDNFFSQTKENIFDFSQKMNDMQSLEMSSIREAIEEKNKQKKGWGIPSEIKEGAEEIIEEDRQYLEDVPF